MARKRDKKRSEAAGARAGGSRGERAAVPATPDGPLTGRTALAIWLTLALLLVARAGLAFVPTMWAWSLNLQRFLAPLLGWGLWLVAALALIPALARRLAPAVSGAGDFLVARPTLAIAAGAVAAAALVGSLPDQVRFVGDFLLRQGTIAEAQKPSELFPQALPLDVLLHYTLPRFLTDTGLVTANGAARAIGMVEAGALAGLAVAFARALALTGAAAAAAAGVVFFGGYLGMFTGFSKAFVEMCLLVAVVGVSGLKVIREGRGLWTLGLALALGVTLHRSAFGLLPAACFAWGAWALDHRAAKGRARAAFLGSVAVPLATIVVMAPRILAIVRRWDAEHFAPSAVQKGGLLAAAFAGTRPADVLCLIAMLSPVALLVPVLLEPLRRSRAPGSGRELLFLALVALPFVVVMPFLHPAQGLFRDWDDFAATGVAISLVAAWAVGRALATMPRHAWLAAPIVLSAAAPSIQWIAHQADQERGFARVRAFMVEPPRRTDAERGTTWDYLGIWMFNLQRWDQAVEALSNAAETSPSPRILQEWALAETMRGHFPTAQRLYYRMLEKQPDNALGWLGLATVSLNMRDPREARRAAYRLLALQPGNSDATRVLEEAQRLEALLPNAPPAGAGR